MFEKKAEDYANKNVPTDAFGYRSLDDVHYDVKQAYLAGVEFGYNKCKEELNQNDGSDYKLYKHCAEIKEPKTRRMTNKELSRWLRENPTREFKVNCNILTSHGYTERSQDVEVSEDILIREDDGEWREPLVGVEE